MAFVYNTVTRRPQLGYLNDNNTGTQVSVGD
jgi:hypothetical protein